MALEQSQQLLSTQAAALAASQDESELQDGVVAATFAATYTPNVSKPKTIITMTLTGNLTVAAPIGARRGMQLTFVFVQDGTGGRTITWNAAFAAAANGAGTSNQVGCTTFFYNGTRWVQDSAALAFKA